MVELKTFVLWSRLRRTFVEVLNMHAGKVPVKFGGLRWYRRPNQGFIALLLEAQHPAFYGAVPALASWEIRTVLYQLL